MAVRVAVDGAPEEDVPGVALFIFLPVIGDQVRVGEQVIEDIGVENGFAVQRLSELVALDILAVLLTFVEVELDFRRVPFERTASVAGLLVLFDFPTVRNERVGIEINDVAFDHDLGRAGEKTLHALHAAALVHKCFDLAEVEIAILDSH